MSAASPGGFRVVARASHHRASVIGFVVIYRAPGGFEHLLGTTLRMRFPGDAESWLARLVETGHYRAFRAADASRNEPLEYRGARVFVVYKQDGDGQIGPGELVAVWEEPRARASPLDPASPAGET